MKEGREDKFPWAKWYWGDWEADAGLRSCGLAAQGLWQRMLSIMARSVRKGYLLDGEKQMESKTLAKHVGESVDVVESLMSELIEHGVPSISEDGTVYNRRMVRDANLSLIRSEAGKLGGRPRKQTESKDENKPKGPSKSISDSESKSEYKSSSNASNVYPKKSKDVFDPLVGDASRFFPNNLSEEERSALPDIDAEYDALCDSGMTTIDRAEFTRRQLREKFGTR